MLLSLLSLSSLVVVAMIAAVVVAVVTACHNVELLVLMSARSVPLFVLSFMYVCMKVFRLWSRGLSTCTFPTDSCSRRRPKYLRTPRDMVHVPRAQSIQIICCHCARRLTNGTLSSIN